MLILMGLCLFLLSFFFTGLFRYHALKAQWLDVPNERSSHVIPTPRGGGIGFVLTFLVALLVYGFYVDYSPLVCALLFLGSSLSLLGWLDDRFGLSAHLRFLIQVLSAAIALHLLGFFDAFSGIGIAGLALFYLVASVNIFNFMDGIDGYAVMETAFISVVMSAFMRGEAAIILSMLACSVLGFGWWNFPRARIFMGDVGSGFLGGMIGLCALNSYVFSVNHFVVWLIMMGLFFSDASLTLLTRLFNQERIWEAHRQHAYQHAAHQLGRHDTVTLFGLGLNVFVLLPLGWLVWHGKCHAFLGFVLAYAISGLIAVFFNAGKKIESHLLNGLR